MTDDLERHRRVMAVFERVRELPPERAAALAEACVANSALHEEVTRLLAADARAGSFLEDGLGRAITGGDYLIGTRVGPYEIHASIGAGAMGEVYRARDTKLRRDVALKILPAVFASDPDRLARFQLEAQVLASLNHPHIGAIYGLEESDGVHALVLELVDGPTVADRIDGRPIAIDESLQIARQIIDALEAAHEHGVIHRDLKPANIKVRSDGTTKVLDFGLAKAIGPLPGSDPAGSPTLANPAMTRMGMIVGTAAYMSPEQATGRTADRRSDIWAFGCVLFEMLTGRRAFAGEDISGTLASVMTTDPDWTLLPPGTPSSIRRLLHRCLEKDRKRRLSDIADARLELDEPNAAAGETASIDQSRRVRRWLPWSIAAACLAVTLSVVLKE